MEQSFFSPLWYRVAEIQPRLRSHVQLHRHVYRGELWYLLQNHVTGKHHRFSAKAYYLIQWMDGQRGLQSIWEKSIGHLKDDAPTQDEVIQLLSQLHNADALVTDGLPDTQELFKRYEKQQRQSIKQKLSSPLAIRVPLFDPEKTLDRFKCLMQPLFGWAGALFWLATVVIALFLAGIHWDELTKNVSDTVLTPKNLLFLWLLFPVVKALHEFGHAFATKIWGGEVHEMGVMFLVFMPVPYVDASAATAFRERYKRVIVGAAGMIVEIFIAAAALFIWILSEPGLVRTLMFNVMLISSVSTLLFNANPLLRFDGYYILSDLIEIPNLAARSNQYLGYLIQRYAFKAQSAHSPATSSGEAAWFFFYSITSFIYRLLIMVAIALFIASKFFVLGICLAAWTCSTLLIFPLVKHIKFLFVDPRLQQVRRRAFGVVGAVFALAALWLLILPTAHWTNAQGVVWLPEKSKVRALEDCQVIEWLAEPGDTVTLNQPLLRCVNNELTTAAEIAELELKEEEIRYTYQFSQNRVKADILRRSIKTKQAHVMRARERIKHLVITSPSNGRFRVPFAQDIPGAYLAKGDLIGYVLVPEPVTLRTVVTQKQVGLVRDGVERVEVKFPSDTAQVYLAEIKREVPSASHQLPSVALGSTGGGNISVDPREPGGLKAFEQIFQFDLALSGHSGSGNDRNHQPHQDHPQHYGSRAWVRLHHEPSPLAFQWARALRQLFLGELGV